MVAANDVLLDSSVSKYSPSDCQRPDVLNKRLVEGKVLLCGYSFSFVVGTASIKKVSQTARALGAAGFVLAVENISPGSKFDPVPVGIPGILITDVSKSMVIFNVSCSSKILRFGLHIIISIVKNTGATLEFGFFLVLSCFFSTIVHLLFGDFALWNLLLGSYRLL